MQDKSISARATSIREVFTGLRDPKLELGHQPKTSLLLSTSRWYQWYQQVQEQDLQVQNGNHGLEGLGQKRRGFMIWDSWSISNLRAALKFKKQGGEALYSFFSSTSEFALLTTSDIDSSYFYVSNSKKLNSISSRNCGYFLVITY